MTQIGSAVGGKLGGNTSVDQQQFPFFHSPGGVTPEQTALADYNYGQNLTEAAGQFGDSPQGGEGGGNSLSTMASQVFGGANMGKALNLASMSDTNQTAAYDAYTNAENIAQQNASAGLAENQQNLQNLVGEVGQAQSGAGLSAGLKAPLPGASQ